VIAARGEVHSILSMAGEGGEGGRGGGEKRSDLLWPAEKATGNSG